MATEWQNPPDADVILRAPGGKEFLAHKLVLSLASPVSRDMFTVPSVPIETTPPKLPIIDVHDPPEALEMFLQIIYPIPNPPIDGLEALASVLKLADKYEAKAVLDAHRGYLSPPSTSFPPIHIYAILCACGREKEAEAIARQVPLASLELLSDPLLQLMTLGHYHQLMQSMVARDKKMREIVGRRKRTLMHSVYTTGGTSCNDAIHQSYSDSIVAALQSAFETDPCVRTVEALGLVFNSAGPPPICGVHCKFRPRVLQESTEGLLGELVKMAKSLPWKGQGAQVE